MTAKSAAYKTEAHNRILMGLIEANFRESEKPDGKCIGDSSVDRSALPHRTTRIILFDRFVLFLRVNDRDVPPQRRLRIKFVDD